MTTQRWRLVLWAVMFTVVAFVVWRARGALIPFAFGALLAYMLTPVVDLAARGLPARAFAFLSPSPHQADVYRRGVAVLLVYVAIGLALFGFGSAIIPVAADQVAEFVEDIPENFKTARDRASEWLAQYRERLPETWNDRIDDYADEAVVTLADRLTEMAERSVGVLTSTIVILFGFLIVPFWMFYALRDRHNVTRNFMQAVPEPAREDAAYLLSIADRLLLRYVRGQLLLGLIVGTAVATVLTLMDIQLSLALGVIAGITELIPIIGPWIGAAPAILIVAATDPDKLLWVGLVYIVVQQVENNLLVPRVQGQAVDLHPAIVILLLIVAGAAFGLIGLLVIVPLTAILRAMFWYADGRLSGSSAAEAFAATHVAPERDGRTAMLTRLLRRWRPAPAPEPAIEERSTPASGASEPGDSS